MDKDKYTLYYPDKTIIGSTQDEWDEADVFGLQMVLDENKDPPSVHMGMNYFMRREGAIFSCNEGQLIKYLAKYCPWIKHGLWIPNEQYEEIHKRVFG